MKLTVKAIKPCKLSLFTFQRGYFPQVVPQEFVGRYVLFKLNNGNTYVIRLFINSQSNDKTLCLLDECVQRLPRSKSINAGQQLSDTSDIQLIASVNYIKSIHISLVFPSALETHKWSGSPKLQILKLMLQMFVHINNSMIHCTALNESFNKLNLHNIIVHNIGNITAGKVVDSTAIVIEKVHSLERFLWLEETENVFPSGLSGPFNKLKMIVSNYFEISNVNYKYKPASSLKILLVGPAGSGKKTLAQRVSHQLETVVVTLEGRELAGRNSEDTQRLWMKKLDEIHLMALEGPCVLLLLHLDVLFFCRSHESFPRNRLLLSKFLNFLDSMSNVSTFVFMATLKSPQHLPKSLKASSKFQHCIYLGVHTEEERCEMLQDLCHDILNSEDILEVGRKTPGFLFSDLDVLVRRVRWKLAETYSNANSSELSSSDVVKVFKECLIGFEKSSSRGELGSVRRDKLLPGKLGGLSEVQRSLEQSLKWPFIYRNLFEHFNLKKASGVLLYGPPGCAKTSLVRALAMDSSLNLLSVSAADLFSPYVGDSEAAVTHLFNQARLSAPTLLFIDEIDALVGSREGSQKGHPQERILNSFLIEMDGVGVKTELSHMESGVVVIGATNRPSAMDPALLRPGRFDRLIYVPPPDLEARKDILKILTLSIPLSETVDLNLIAEETHLYSGADLTSLSRQAGLEALSDDMEADKVDQKHWLRALKLIKPSLTELQVSRYLTQGGS